ncbi:MAG: YjbH domain-containing protein [Rhodobacterales bacterium]|nr:YjbH domain-containing protein [Rhodobacterales bacterium]
MAERSTRFCTAVSAIALFVASSAAADDRGVTYTLYGTPGLIEMPTAISAADAEIAGTLSYFPGQVRTTFTFQISPNLSGSFRYSAVQDYTGDGEGSYFDRSFDLRYRINDETNWIPAFAVGLQDFLGTGLFSAEYVVATKTLTDSIRVSAGLGWGRLGSYNAFYNPVFPNRPPVFNPGDTGGTLAFKSYFRGDMAFFGGIEWAAADNFTLKAEYSSDDSYKDLYGNDLIERNSPLNFGLVYEPTEAFQIGLSYLYGSELALTGTVRVNPLTAPFPGGLDSSPPPVVIRSSDTAAARTWEMQANTESAIAMNVREAFIAEGLELNSIEISDVEVRVRYTNLRYRTESQGLGRAARVLTAELPASIEIITLEPMQLGIPLSGISFNRTDLETLENSVGGSEEILARAQMGSAGAEDGLIEVDPVRDAFSWGIAPYMQLIFFNGSEPLQATLGVEASASYVLRPGLFLTGAIRQPIYLKLDDDEIIYDPDLPVVRRNSAIYSREGMPAINYLTLASYGRLSTNVYTRITAGYLEEMFGGISAEVLYQPFDTRWALGAELNYVGQRDFNQLFGFQDYRVAMGHGSLYYSFENDYVLQLDVGRYLAGDWGATFTFNREFDNGWQVGAYFTLTDVPFDEYGEGSFDKGIIVEIPIDFIFGQPNRRTVGTTLRSLNRDGGAQLYVDGRLYDVVREGNLVELTDAWGRFWR